MATNQTDIAEIKLGVETSFRTIEEWIIINNQNDASNGVDVLTNTTEIADLTGRVDVLEDGSGDGSDFSNATTIIIGSETVALDFGVASVASVVVTG